MKSIFLRIYGGMLLALLLVSGLGLLGLHWINEVRASTTARNWRAAPSA